MEAATDGIFSMIYYMYYTPMWQGCFDPVKIIIHLLRDNSCDQGLDLVVKDGYGVGTTSIQGYTRLKYSLHTTLVQGGNNVDTTLRVDGCTAL